jgi:hypothetical protein
LVVPIAFLQKKYYNIAISNNASVIPCVTATELSELLLMRNIRIFVVVVMLAKCIAKMYRGDE